MGGWLVYTVGHSTRGLGELCRLLESAGSRLLVDVRRWAASRRSPHFSSGSLRGACGERGIGYVHLPALGGYRRFGRDVEDMGWFRCFESEGFRAYATYLLTSPQAQRALEAVVYAALSGSRPTVMCSERVPWRCHRKVIADWLVLHGFRVVHIIEEGRLLEHTGTSCLGEMGERLGRPLTRGRSPRGRR